MPHTVPTLEEFDQLRRAFEDRVEHVEHLRNVVEDLTARVAALENPPVDCVMSEWTLLQAANWGPCVDGVQTRQESWTRRVITPAANGGKACGPLFEQRIGTRACEVAPPPPPDPVDCVQSEWSEWSAWSPWMPDGAGTDMRVRSRTRAILVEPAHGGAACGPESEVETETRQTPPTPPLDPDEGDHGYFEGLIARPECWKAVSFRPRAGAPQGSPYAERQLDGSGVGGYRHTGNLPSYVTYDPMRDAAQVRVPAFVPVGALKEPLTETGTRLYPAGMPSQFVVGVQLKVDAEYLVITQRDGADVTPRGLTVARSQFGSVPAAHMAGTPIGCANNSLPSASQIRVPLGTEDGHRYLFTWDARYDLSCVGTGLTSWKMFQFTSGGSGSSIWAEVRTRFDGGSPRALGFDPAVHVGAVDLRMYQATGGAADWLQTDGNRLGPGVTDEDPLAPMAARFVIAPDRWIRYFVLLDQRPSDYDELSVWMADATTDPVCVYDSIPVSVKNGRVDQLWVEANTSSSRLTAGRLTDLRDMVVHVRNFVALRDVPSVADVLRRPA